MELRKKNIQIGLVGPSWPFRGGIAKYTTELAHQLSKKGHLASFINPKKQYPQILFPGKTQKDEHSCNRVSSSKSIYSYYEPWTWRAVLKELEASKADCIVVPHWSLVSAPFLSYLTRRSSKPVIAIVHNFTDHGLRFRSRRISEWVLNKGAGYLHHNPEFSKLDFFKTRSERVECQLLPIIKNKQIKNTSPKIGGPKKKIQIPEGLVTFLFFGLIRPYKGLNILLDAMESLPPQAPIALLIAGEPWGKNKELEIRLQKMAKNRWIQWELKWISEEETPIWFSAADVVVLPYLEATGSAVAAQALSFGKPILATRTGSLPYIIKHGENGLICESNNTSDLANGLTRFLNQKLRDKLTRGAKTSGLKDWSSYVEGLVRIAEKSLTPIN